MPKRIKIIIRGFVSSALLFYLITILEWKRFTILITGINKWYLLIAPLLLLVGFLFSAIRWRYLLANLKIYQKIKNLYAYYLVGAFYSIFLPGVLGGDIVRIGFCARDTKTPVSIITTSVIVERACGVVILFFIAAIVIFNLPEELLSVLGMPMIHGINTVAVLFLIAIVVILIIKLKFHNINITWGKKKSYVAKLGQIAQMLLNLPISTILWLLIISALFQATDILCSYVIAMSLNMNVELYVFFTIMPIVYIFTILPISLGGIGVREGVLVYLLSKVGVASSDAVTLSFLIYFNRVIVGSIGGGIQMFWRRGLL